MKNNLAAIVFFWRPRASFYRRSALYGMMFYGGILAAMTASFAVFRKARQGRS